MKKIFIILSVLSLFVGCASKPAAVVKDFSTSFEENNLKKDAMTHEEYMDLQYEKAIEDFKKAIYAPEIEKKDIQKIKSLSSFNYNNYNQKSDRKIVEPFDTDRNDFSGKITNDTDKPVLFRIRARYSYKRIDGKLPDIEFEIPPHETYYFIIENFIYLGEDIITIDDKAGEYVSVEISPSNFDKVGGETLIFNPSNFSICKEILKTHSLEFVYDHRTTLEDIRNGTINYRFIEPLEDVIQNEENLVILHQ